MDRTLDSTLLHTLKLRLLTDYPAQIRACLDRLTDEQVWWRPNEHTTAIGNILVHLSWSNRYYLEEVIGGHPIGRRRDEEFAVRGGQSKTEVLALYETAVQAARRILEGLAADQLMTATEATGKQTTYAQLLLHVSHHNADHVGQVVWITKLLQPGSITDLWMQARAKPAG